MFSQKFPVANIGLFEPLPNNLMDIVVRFKLQYAVESMLIAGMRSILF